MIKYFGCITNLHSQKTGAIQQHSNLIKKNFTYKNLQMVRHFHSLYIIIDCFFVVVYFKIQASINSYCISLPKIFFIVLFNY